MKALIKRLAFGAPPMPAHVAVGLPRPAEVVRVSLERSGTVLDVSADHVPVSLRPFTVGVCLDRAVTTSDLRRASLVFRDWAGDRPTRGRLRLRPTEHSIDLGSHRLWLFQVAGSTNGCLPLVQLQAREIHDWWGRRKRANPYNFRMTAADLRAINVYYIRPRPVSLVTVVDDDASNIFPMDLIGPVSSGHFLLALRSTSPAITLMSHIRRVAVSAVPASFKHAAYALGAHHRERSIDLGRLPFATVASPEFRLPAPADALVVRELAIRDIHTVGSHTLFVTDIVRETPGTRGDALCHVASPYAYRRGMPLLPD
jgi:flavin reductase (DIM6/NTAB) family NADH-FMN oxidoreductase RutF